MPLDLQLFLVTVFFVFFQGVPRILKRVKMPVRLNFVQVSESSFNEKQKKHYGELDEKMADLGFAPVLNYRITNLPGPNISRCYLSAMDPARMNAVLLLGSSTQKNPIQVIYLEIVTNFKDETSLNTINSDTTSIFDLLPGRIRQKLPGIKDPAELKRRHDLKVEELKDKGLVWVKKDDILPRHEKYHQLFCDYQVQRGLLRLEPGADYYNQTLKTALRGVRNYLNPFDKSFLWRNFFWALAGGVVVPILGIYFTTPIVECAHQATGWNIINLTWILDILLYAFGGAVVGYVFARRVFVWGFILAYFPFRILTLLGLISFDARFIYLSLLLTSVATEVSHWRSKRERVF